MTTERGIAFCPFCGVRLYDEDSINININKNVKDYAKLRKAEAYEKIQLEKMKKEGNTQNIKRFYGFVLMITTILATALVFIATGIAEVVIFGVFGLLLSFMLISS